MTLIDSQPMTAELQGAASSLKSTGNSDGK